MASRLMKFNLADLPRLLKSLPRAVAFYDGSVWRTIWRAFVLLNRHGIKGVILRAKMLNLIPPSAQELNIASTDVYQLPESSEAEFYPKISVIVPNFNHATYLTERLNSIYDQSYKNIEVILLDDCSTDNSAEIIRQFADAHPHNTTCHFNAVNSGNVFKQWAKGLALATGELVWIAESDDYCSSNFLEELVDNFLNSAVMLAFSRTTFVRGNPAASCWTSEEYLADLGLNIWRAPFTVAAHSLVKMGWVAKNIVPNASAALFRHPGRLSLLNDSAWLSMRVCGDWMFYLSIIRGGLVAYTTRATNYYRQHPANVSVNFQSDDAFFKEHEVVGKHLVQLFKLDKVDIERQRDQLYRHWCLKRGADCLGSFNRQYDLESIWLCATQRKPNIVMAIFALIAGGGETFPIMLANLLHERGYGVTIFNCKLEETEPGVRGMIPNAIPVLELERVYLAGKVFSDMGVELVHSHHASVDLMLTNLLATYPDMKRIISMHGMYDLMTLAQQRSALRKLDQRIDCFVYTAEKNLVPFPSEFRESNLFTKIPNALAPTIIHPVSRAELGVGVNDFVLCLVSRAIPAKGWQEGIEAVSWANSRSNRTIHLLLIGEGLEFDRLSQSASLPFIHYLGFRSNIRDYFAAADMGFLPSRFKGESFPLVVIDCIYAGRPVLASNVGEIKNMLWTEGGLAGEVFELTEWKIPVESLGEIILSLANSPDKYRSLLERTGLAAKKFDPMQMVDSYESVYQTCLNS